MVATPLPRTSTRHGILVPRRAPRTAASALFHHSIAAAFRMQTIVAEAGFCDTLRIVCGRSDR